jgi:hypothetical protein
MSQDISSGKRVSLNILDPLLCPGVGITPNILSIQNSVILLAPYALSGMFRKISYFGKLAQGEADIF